jgi:hypothetical protein
VTTRFPDSLLRELTPVIVLVAQEKLQVHLPRGAESLVCTRRHHELTHLELAKEVKLLNEELETSFQHGESMWVGITIPRLAGTVVRSKQLLMARSLRFVFSCRHRRMRRSAAMDSLLLRAVYVSRLPGR